MKRVIYLFTGLSILLYFTACDNLNINTSSELSDELTIAEVEVGALKSAESVEEEVDAAKFAYNFADMYNPHFKIPRYHFGNHFPECANVTVENDSFPKTITIEYGEDCVTRRGLVKTGTVVITISDSVRTPGSTYTVEYIDLQVGPRLMNLYATHTYEGPNADSNEVVSWEYTSTTVIRDSITIVREGERTKEWLDGFGTPYIDDDKFLLNGNATASINDNIEYTRTIIDPLYVDRACRFILSGVVEIDRNGEIMLIDFGEGECDNIATVTKDGESEEIELISERFRDGFQRKHRNMRKDKGWW